MQGSLGVAAAAAVMAFAALGATAAAEVGAAPPGPAQCVATSAAEGAAAVEATNAVRASRGLPPVKADKRLARVAAEHACDMAQRGTMSHSGSGTSGPAQRVKARGYKPSVTAENIAAGPYGLAQVLDEWNRSPGHLGNILIPQVRDIGIGRAIGADGRTVFWAAVYAAPRGR